MIPSNLTCHAIFVETMGEWLDILLKYKNDELRLYRAFLRHHEGEAKGKVDNSTLDDDQCRLCLQRGHWGQECPFRKVIKTEDKTKEKIKEELADDENGRDSVAEASTTNRQRSAFSMPSWAIPLGQKFEEAPWNNERRRRDRHPHDSS